MMTNNNTLHPPSLTSNCSWGGSCVDHVWNNDNNAQWHPSHTYKQLLVEWIVDAAWLECQVCSNASICPPLL